jgi:energy-coupling factor transport system permease protein
MQLVPDLVAEAQQMRLASAMKSGRLLRTLPGPWEALSLAVPLRAYAVRRAGRTAIAMEARGLSTGPCSFVNVPSFTRGDGVFVALAIAVMVLCGLPILLG